MKFSTRDLCFCAIGAALIAVCAWISIPADVPFTLQTFAIFAVCGLLGGKRGTVSVLVYLLLGAVGAPVFAGFRGGFASLIDRHDRRIPRRLHPAGAHHRPRAGALGTRAVGVRAVGSRGAARVLRIRHGVVSHRLHPHGRDRSRSAWCWQSACCRFCCRTRSSSRWRRCCARGCTGASRHKRRKAFCRPANPFVKKESFFDSLKNAHGKSHERFL